MNPIIYLASPYTHEQEVVRLARARMTKHKVAELMSLGRCVYSPICHNVDVARFLSPALRDSHDFWMSVDLPILRRCDELWVLQLVDWQLSKGIARELEEAKILKLPIRYIEYAATENRGHSDFPHQTEKGLRSGVAPAASGLD